MLIPISYSITKDTPLYPNIPAPVINSHLSINHGDSANTSLITFSNHTGTHIDLPLHFCRNGASVSDILSYENVFSPACCINIPKNSSEPVRPEDFLSFLPGIIKSEALLVQTGVHRLRGTPAYLSDYPWIDPAVPDFFRKNLIHLKLFGIDTLSVSNPSYRDEGRECHRNFLCKSPVILILEDVDLSSPLMTTKSWHLRVFPWICDVLDAVPVVALLEDISSDIK